MKTFLVVDDVKGWRVFHESVINKLFGNEVTVIKAESARDAYNILLQKVPFDAIITDLQMEDDFAPKQAGEWLIEQIKTFSCYYKTPIVLISASYNARMIAERLGVECIPKSTAQASISSYEDVLKK